MSFDISTKSVAETFDVEIIDTETGEPLLGEGGKPCTITVYGPGSKPFAAAKSAASNRAVQRLRQRGAKAKTTAEEDAASTASFLSAITTSFNNFDYKGKPNEPETFRALYLDLTLGFITEQVNAAAGDWANFTKTSSPN